MKKTKKGFTLLEMIVAVGLLSFMSVSILKVFLAAKDLNEKAKDLHQSVLMTRSMVALLDEGEFSRKEGSLHPYLLHLEKGEAEGEYLLYLDAEFAPVSGKTLQSPEKRQASDYLWSMRISREDEKEGSDEPPFREGLHRIDVAVFRNKPYSLNKDIEMPIYTLSFTRFFSGEEESR